MNAQVTSCAVYKTTHWQIETDNDTYYVQCQEDDIYDTWFITSDNEGSIDPKSDLGEFLKSICEQYEISNNN